MIRFWSTLEVWCYHLPAPRRVTDWVSDRLDKAAGFA